MSLQLASTVLLAKKMEMLKGPGVPGVFVPEIQNFIEKSFCISEFFMNKSSFLNSIIS